MAQFGIVLGVATLLAGVTPALAQTVTAEAAAGMLYPPKAAEVELTAPDALPEDQAKVLQMVAMDQPYYGAIAISPDEGLMSEATVAAANYHDVGAASTAALADCNAKKKAASDCVVVATVRPEGWQAQGVQLSSDATAAFQADLSGAVAVSAGTGSWGLGATAEAAVAACQQRNAAAQDCTVLIEP